MPTQLEPVADGGNPQDAAAIEQVAEDHFRVRPYSEDGDGNYKFALCVRIVNPHERPRPFRLEVDWADEQYMEARRFLYIGDGDDWQFVPAQVDGAVAAVTHAVAPGHSYVGLSPAYSLGDFERFAGGLSAAGYDRSLAGRSNEGREIAAFAIGSGPRRVLVTARYHPYETASSYCLEGMMAWLAAAEPAPRALLEQFRFTLVPMPNPDGVYRGLCKRTAVGGVDLSHEGAHGGDATTRVLLGVIDATRPHGFLDIHGWMYMEEDGLHYLDPALADGFLRHIGPHPAFAGNKWKRDHPSGADPGSIRPYANRRHGTDVLALSYRWPGRTVPHMRAVGGPTLEAFCVALSAAEARP